MQDTTREGAAASIHLISVVMPVYNGQPFLSEAIESVLKQTHENLELIVVECGSKDASATIVRAYAGRDARVRPLFLPLVSRGRALNEGAAVARGAWFSFVHADNVMLRHSLATQLSFAKNHAVDVCGACAKRFGDRDGIVWRPSSHDAIGIEFLFGLAILPSVLTRTEIVRQHRFDETTSVEDQELWTRLWPTVRTGNLQQILFKLRMHPQQASVREHGEVTGDLQSLRKQQFFRLFPDASDDDYATVAAISDKMSITSAEGLRRAGEWLVRLADVNNGELSRRMGRRWFQCCMRAASLGPHACIYEELAPAFQGLTSNHAQSVWAACVS